MVEFARRFLRQVDWHALVVVGGLFLAAAFNNLLAAALWLAGLFLGFLDGSRVDDREH